MASFTAHRPTMGPHQSSVPGGGTMNQLVGLRANTQSERKGERWSSATSAARMRGYTSALWTTPTCVDIRLPCKTCMWHWWELVSKKGGMEESLQDRSVENGVWRRVVEVC